MQTTLSRILDYSIDTGCVSVMNYNECTMYFIPYDGILFDELLATMPDAFFESEIYNESDKLQFAILCQYSHVGADNHLNIKYTLWLGDVLLATEFAPMPNRASEKIAVKPNSLLHSAEKCAKKIIAQEMAALKYNMIKSIQTRYES